MVRKSREEYEVLSEYDPGAGARAHYGLLLGVLEHRAEARPVFAEVLKQAKRAPKYVGKVQAEWIAIAERELAFATVPCGVWHSANRRYKSRPNWHGALARRRSRREDFLYRA